MRSIATCAVLVASLFFTTPAMAQERSFPLKAKRILFLGDSITHAGHFISLVEVQARLQGVGPLPELINLGLPSETCSGLSEPDHPFPRPDVHERIGRALEKLKPDVVVACYGMNDGIYYPFSDDRFDKYKDGVKRIIDKVHAASAKLVLMTPPAFDPLPLKKTGKLLPAGAEKYAWFSIYEDYDSVLKKYAAWLMTQSDQVEMVIDLHTPVNEYVAKKRKADPDFTMSPDGVHVNNEGHEVLAAAILKAWGLKNELEPEPGLMKLVSDRQTLLHDAWLSEVGHKRPGVKPGIPINEALESVRDSETQIKARVLKQRDTTEPAGGRCVSVHYPGSDKPGELQLFADYYLWIPPDCKNLRGVIVHQHGCGGGASTGGLTAANDLHWQSLARKWDCALMGSSYEARRGASCRLWCDPRNGSADRFLQALSHFATTTGHDELEAAPWCLWGHSGGGFWASLMQTMYPDRIVAIWLQSGTAFGYWESGDIERPTIPDSAFLVPVMACPGRKEQSHERFKNAWNGSHAMTMAYRAKNAPFGFAPDPLTGHECGDSRYLAIPFFDTCLDMRLQSDTWPTLKPIDQSQAWLSPLDDESKPKPIPAALLKGDHSAYGWLPDQSFADRWTEFVTNGGVNDTTAPPSVILSAKTVSGVGIELSWSCDADLESGVAAFRIQRDGKPLAQLPERADSRFGRPIFQRMSYHDSPELPLPQLRYVDATIGPAKAVTYELITVNSRGLESKPATVTLNVQ